MTRIIMTLLALCISIPLHAETIGDDGLHKTDWMRDTFKDLNEDLADANAEGKRLMVMVEQRGCIYCAKMHKEVFPREDIASYIRENFFVVQMNLHGDTDMTDLDGEVLSEKQATRKWGLLFTPSIMFLPEEIKEGQSAQSAAVAVMPGAFSAGTTLDMLTWVVEKRYDLGSEEDFQRYHARRIKERATE